MKNGGKIFLFIILFYSISLASVRSYVDKTKISMGQRVVFTIESTKRDTVFPDLDNIAGYMILGSPVTKSTQIINSKITIRNTKSYIFEPTKDLTIPALDVIADGKTYTTAPIKISVSKAKQTKDRAYRFNISVDNKNPYIFFLFSISAHKE